MPSNALLCQNFERFVSAGGLSYFPLNGARAHFPADAAIMRPREPLSSSGSASDYFAAHTSTADIPGEERVSARKKPLLPAAGHPTHTRFGHFSAVWRTGDPCAPSHKRFRSVDMLHAIEVRHSRRHRRWPPARRHLRACASQSSPIGSRVRFRRVRPAHHRGSDPLPFRLLVSFDSSTAALTRLLSAAAKTASRPRCKSNIVGVTN